MRLLSEEPQLTALGKRVLKSKDPRVLAALVIRDGLVETAEELEYIGKELSRLKLKKQEIESSGHRWKVVHEDHD